MASQYREYTAGSLSSAMWCFVFMQIYAVYWLRPASSAFSLARTCNRLAAIMVMRCVVRHARTPKFQLSGPTVHSLYCDGIVGSIVVDVNGKASNVFFVWFTPEINLLVNLHRRTRTHEYAGKQMFLS